MTVRTMRVLVCGGRHYNNRAAVFYALDRLHGKRGIDVVIHGGAAGADSLAGEWAMERGIRCREFKADWNARGNAAGPIRNQRMIDEGQPDGVVAFPGRNGTNNMIDKARAAGLVVWRPSK